MQNKIMNTACTTAIIKPLWKTNWERTAERRYESLPCQRTSFFKSLNLLIEKSEARAAYSPSLPSIPMPTSDSIIMPTSFPPSPIEAILFPLVQCLREMHTSAFCVGEHLQIHTQGAQTATWKNASLASQLFSIVCKVFPSIMIVVLATDLLTS